MVRYNLLRLLPFIGYHHVLMFLILISITLQCVLLAGCTSENLNGMFLFSLSYADHSSPRDPNPIEVNRNASAVISSLSESSASLQVRSGYFGMCLSSGTGWICSKSAARLASIIRQSQPNGRGDPLNLIYAAQKFRTDVVFPGLLFISIAFAFITLMLLYTFPGWHKEEHSEGSEREVRPFPARNVSMAALGCITVSTIMALLSSFWQHMAGAAASTMAEVFTYGAVTGNVGAGAMACGWLSFFLLMLPGIGLLVMIQTIRVLMTLSL